MSDLVDLAGLPLLEIWGEQVRARRLEGERITLAVVELAPGALVPQHRHPQEQLGICVRGSVTFRVGDEVRDLGPGGTWRVAPDMPHEVVAGPDGAIAIDVFAPTRSDWDFPILEPRPPLWPASEDEPPLGEPPLTQDVGPTILELTPPRVQRGLRTSA